MAEAFAALSIAANIAQFVVYAKQLLSGAKEIYNSLEGATDEHQALKVIIEDIRQLSDETTPPPLGPRASDDEKALLILARQCKPVTDTVLEILKDLEVPRNARFRRWQSLRQTFRSAAKKKKIRELQGTLEKIDVRMRNRASRMLQKQNYANITSTIDTIYQRNERLKVDTDLILEKLRTDILQTLEIASKDAAKGYARLDNLSRQFLALAEEGAKAVQEQQILESLVFEEMQLREEAIKDAHKTTLDWMFEKRELKFMHWLEAENGIYWIKGKAGSGKSTLMKYVCNHSNTLGALRSWAGSEKLFTANFFFWNAGTPMQKSQIGLLQSLLYQVLLACPALILEVCRPKRGKGPWNRKELFETLDKVANQKVLPPKFCFFIDGLDEYESEHEDLIALLQDFASSPSIKLCISSRPWNPFLDAFEDSQWKLVLEDLTKDDMRKYVHTMLVENPISTRVAKHDQRCETLVPQIAEKAQGVWLWVWLVVRDLLRDLKGEEEFPLLQRRLDSFPDELEKYFANILGRIDKIHREATAKLFLMAMETVKPIPLLSLNYLSMETEDRDYALKLNETPITEREVFQTKMKWRKLLNSRCRDLLEATGTIKQDERFLDNKVDFLHRTVRDFLRGNYQDELRKRTGDHFDAKYSLCSAIVALIKVSAVATSATLPRSIPNLGIAHLDLVDELLYYARNLEQERGQSLTALLDELDRMISIRFKHATGYDFHWTNAKQWYLKQGPVFEEVEDCTFLALAIEAGLRLYVRDKLDCDQTPIFMKRGRPLIDYALKPAQDSYLLYRLERLERRHGGPLVQRDAIIDPQMVRLLLKRGSDPNQQVCIDGETVWKLFFLDRWQELRKFIEQSESHNPSFQRSRDAVYETIELMIDHGADPKVRVPKIFASEELRNPTTGSEMVVEDISLTELVDAIFGHDKAARLKSRMDEMTPRMDEAVQRNQSQTSILRKLLGWRSTFNVPFWLGDAWKMNTAHSESCSQAAAQS